MAAERPPVDRRVLLAATSVLVLVVAVAIIGNMLFVGTPNAQRERAEAEERAEQVEAQEPGRVEELERALAAREAEVSELKRREEAEARRREIADGTRGVVRRTTDPTREDVPPVDQALLDALAEADEQAGRRPGLTGGTGETFNGGAMRSGSGAPGSGAGFGIYESYGGSSIAAPGTAIAREDDDAVESEDPRVQRPQGRESVDSSFFETTVPELAPSTRIVAQGSQIRAVLLSRIDTRNPGNVIAQVTADVYDTRRAELLLIPRGSRVLGSYATQVSPGNRQLAIAFSRLVLPDGRALDLGGMQAVGNDGITGIRGEYHGNVIRAIGPAILTAIVGSALDEATRPDASEVSPGQVPGTTVQSPTVAQQVVPDITDAVLERYRGAQPYVTAEAGQALKILVTADLEIPELVEDAK